MLETAPGCEPTRALLLAPPARAQTWRGQAARSRAQRGAHRPGEAGRSGKEEDVEVGLQYFGARYLVVGLGRWASADAATIHYFRADPNPYAYVAGRPTVAVDPNGNEPVTIGVIVTAVVVGALIGAVVGGAVNVAVQWHEKKRLSKVELGEVGIAMGAGAAAGAASGGVGVGVASAFASATAGSVAGGAAGGAAGGGAGYMARWGLSGGKQRDFSASGLVTTIGVGALIGAATGYASAKLADAGEPAPTGKAIKTTRGTFESDEGAAHWASSRFQDSAMRHDQEFQVELYQNKTTGRFRMSDAYAGEPGTGTVDPPAPAPKDGERWAGSWHPHPKGDLPSEGHYKPGGGPGIHDRIDDPGDRARLNMYTAHHGPGARSFVSTGGRMRSIDANTIKVPDHGRLVYARPWAGASAFAGGTAATATAGLWNSLFE